MLTLHVLNGVDKGLSFRLTGDGPEIIGRHSARLRLHDTRVSREHCRIERRGGDWVIHDLGASNGTYVNGHRIVKPTPVTDDDELTIGRLHLRVEVEAAVATVEGEADPSSGSSSDRPQAVPVDEPAGAEQDVLDLDPASPPADPGGAAGLADDRPEVPSELPGAQGQLPGGGVVRAASPLVGGGEPELVSLEPVGAEAAPDDAGAAAERAAQEARQRAADEEATRQQAEALAEQQRREAEAARQAAAMHRAAQDAERESQAAQAASRAIALTQRQAQDAAQAAAAADAAAQTRFPEVAPTLPSPPEAPPEVSPEVSPAQSTAPQNPSAVTPSLLDAPPELPELPASPEPQVSQHAPPSPPARPGDGTKTPAPAPRRRPARAIGLIGLALAAGVTIYLLGDRFGFQIPAVTGRAQTAPSPVSGPIAHTGPTLPQMSRPATALDEGPRLIGSTALEGRVATPPPATGLPVSPSTPPPPQTAPSKAPPQKAAPEPSPSPPPPGVTAKTQAPTAPSQTLVVPSAPAENPAPGNTPGNTPERAPAVVVAAAMPDPAPAGRSAPVQPPVTRTAEPVGAASDPPDEATGGSVTPATPSTEVEWLTLSPAPLDTPEPDPAETLALALASPAPPIPPPAKGSPPPTPGLAGAGAAAAASSGTEAAAPRRVAFLLDASGSTVDSLPRMIRWLGGALDDLDASDQFTVIFFRHGTAMEAQGVGLKDGSAASRRQVWDWVQLERENIETHGRSDAQVALRLALSYGVNEIYMLSDDTFGGRKRANGGAAIVDQITACLAGRDVAIHTVQFYYKDRDGLLRAIAKRFDGTYEFVKPIPVNEPVLLGGLSDS